MHCHSSLAAATPAQTGCCLIPAVTIAVPAATTWKVIAVASAWKMDDGVEASLYV